MAKAPVETRVIEIVKIASVFTDEETTQLVKALLDAKRLVINPQIVVQVQKLPEPVTDTFEQHVKESTETK